MEQQSTMGESSNKRPRFATFSGPPVAEVMTPSVTDRISMLPDSLLCHILSFLPIAQAAAVSVLSKRWRKLWTMVPKLDFSDEDRPIGQTGTSFAQFVYRVLLQRNAPIEGFRLKCESSSCDYFDIKNWVETVFRSQLIEQLELSVPTNVMPSCIFTFGCRTITVLKLGGFIVFPPSSAHLPSLKTLHLENVTIIADSLEKILFGCPVLEDLFLSFNADILVPWFRKNRNEFQLNLSKLIEGDLDIRLDDILRGDFMPWARNILRGFQNVQILSFSAQATRAFMYASVYDIPIFHNLFHLEIAFETYCWGLITKLLHHSRRLEVLVLHHKLPSVFLYKIWRDPEAAPECFSSCLRTIYFREYYDMPCELEFTRYILKNARKLETVTICIASSIKLKTKLRKIKELCACPRSSETCQLLVY